MAAAVDGARWRLGPIRVDPWLGLRDAAWVKNRGQEGDFTATVGAGLRGYLPVGRRLVLAAHVLPEYIWWEDREEDRRLGGRAGLGMFVYGNRFIAEIEATGSDLDAYVSPEVQQRTGVEDRRLAVHVEVPLGYRLALFTRAERSTVEVRDTTDPGSDLSALDRQNRHLEGGLRFVLTPSIRLGVGAGTTRTDFDQDARDRSNDGSYLLGELDWSRPKLSVGISARRNELAGVDGSELGDVQETTWGVRANWTPRSRISLGLYGLRSLQYSVTADEAFFLEERLGARLGLRFGTRLGLSGFHEQGDHRYSEARRDDVTSWGSLLSFELSRGLRLELVERTTEIDSEVAPARVREAGLRLAFGLGSGSGLWF